MSRAEKYISEHAKKLTQYGDDYFLWITPDQARKAVEIAREEMIEKVCMYLNEHRNGVIDDEYIINLNKAMKNE